MLAVIAAAGVLMVIGTLFAFAYAGELTTATIVATVSGVFVSVLLGCGLFAAAFFSDKSGHDDAVTWATSAGRQVQLPSRCRDLAFTADGPDADEITACVSRGFCSRC
jgi:hypothetical protein